MRTKITFLTIGLVLMGCLQMQGQEQKKEHGCLAGLDAIQAVLAKLSECIPEIVSQGYGVMLDGLGKFYPTLKSKGATEAEMAEEGW